MQKTLNLDQTPPLHKTSVSRSTLLFGDCLIESDKIENGSVDLILTDLPYGTMEGQSKTGIYHNGEEKHQWDSIIDTDKIMQVANRILRKNGKMILFAQEPFTRELINKAIPNIPFFSFKTVSLILFFCIFSNSTAVFWASSSFFASNSTLFSIFISLPPSIVFASSLRVSFHSFCD